MPPSLTSTASSTIPSIPAPLRVPLLALTALYFFPLWALDGMQLALSIIQLKGGPVARSDPSGVDLTFPPAAEHLQRLAIAWASLGVVAHAVLGVVLPAAVGGLARRVGEEEDHDGGGEEGEGRGRGWFGRMDVVVQGADGENVITATRVAHGNTADSVMPYTANPITLSPIPEGTFVNDTHVSSTFLCSGCINSDSFDPAWADSTDRAVFFGYAFSQVAVESPSDINTTLSDHSGQGAGYGAFKMDLNSAKSDDYDRGNPVFDHRDAGGHYH
ncbi:hypothetical protein NEMBOFW57_008617 [Staphylotrichum longicolle]|uniref:Cellobiose dehydrogenase-like cytochrome domain-containing protein n=1 Tax=Staphylotrichum longicolle TaxID=669026 RepID=A0AAD4HZ31_9PEZI|nr:hypothetical protein NEMBOFW57_008617 [Staphylotrichum longicolle]